MNKEETTITFKEQTGFRISEEQCDITTGKVVVNGIEITSTEDWEKVTKSLIDLQQENEGLKRSYARREKKWEKFETQKNALSSAMSNYLCKYQNLKREYKIQNNRLHNYKQENQSLKQQNEYLRSGEYLNQLKFERNMLEDIVQNGGVSEEDKEFIDMTHRNTELLEENQSLKEKLLKLEDKYIHNVPCCNEEDCNLFRDYQLLKDRIEKAIEYIENNTYTSAGSLKTTLYIQNDELYDLLEILKGDK